MKTTNLLLVFSTIVGLGLLTTPFIAPQYLGLTKTSMVTNTTTITSIELETHLSTLTSLQLQFPCKGTALCWEGTINRIVDGDTLVVDTRQIRLALVSAPGLNELGATAKSFVEKLCQLGDKAIVDQDDKQRVDDHGRILAVVWCKGKNLNAELLYAGIAKIETKFCAWSEFRNETWAKKYGC